MSAGNPDSAFTFLSRGASIQEFKVAGHNIVQSFPEASLYKTHNAVFLGETIGRTTNRIKNAVIQNLNNKTYELAANDGPHSLHGGSHGWGKQEFEGPNPVHRNGKEGVYFKYVSKDGEGGYPGTVECYVWYTASMEEGKTVLEVEYQVELVGDECGETVVGVTNHSYFNLNPPAPTIEGTIVTLGTNDVLELDATHAPTGNIMPFPDVPPPGTAFTLGASEPVIDHCFVIDTSAPASCPLDTRLLPLHTIATLSHLDSGLHLEIQSTEPAFQVYTADAFYLPEVRTADSSIQVPARGKRAGIAIEPSRYINAAGKEEWRGMCKIRGGDLWGARTVYRAWKE
ncbi:MAG: hypothetical protein Q9167_003555 [Letrouitia subvulpina]